MDWQDILGLGVWAAVVTAATNVLSTWWFSRAQRNQLAIYYATRICVELERYAYICAGLISEENNYYASNGSVGEQFIELPPLAVDVDTDWKTLDLHLVHRVLQFQNDIIRSQGVVSGAGYHLTPDDRATEPMAQAGLLGYRAHRLAADLRTRYPSLPPRQEIYPWDYLAQLKELHDLKMEEYDHIRNIVPY